MYKLARHDDIIKRKHKHQVSTLLLFGGVQILGRCFNPTSGVKVTLFEELEDTGELN
jgi:CobQ-like glutamine amidotransferase family enzyme